MNKLAAITALAAIPFAAGALTNEELAGPWCYSYYEAAGEREVQIINYIFKEDGTLLYQNNPVTPVEKPGTYSIDGNKIELKPTFMMFNLVVKSEAGDRFVLDAFGDHVFVRGECQ